MTMLIFSAKPNLKTELINGQKHQVFKTSPNNLIQFGLNKSAGQKLNCCLQESPSKLDVSQNTAFSAFLKLYMHLFKVRRNKLGKKVSWMSSKGPKETKNQKKDPQNVEDVKKDTAPAKEAKKVQ